jgi:hypothetical protein
MAESIEKVCVRIPAYRRKELLAIAEVWRTKELTRSQGWDAKAIHAATREHFGSLAKLFEEHGWPERGSDMMQKVQSRVKLSYGSIEDFVRKFPIKIK